MDDVAIAHIAMLVSLGTVTTGMSGLPASEPRLYEERGVHEKEEEQNTKRGGESYCVGYPCCYVEYIKPGGSDRPGLALMAS